MLTDNRKTLSMYNYMITTRCVGTDKKEKKHTQRSHVDDVLAGDSSSRVLPVRRPVSGADVEASVDVVPHCIQYNEGAKPRDDGE